MDAAGGWGLFNHLAWPGWIEFALCFLALDFAIWLQHLLPHKIPVLSHLRRVHHANRDVDVTTGICFRPVEIALSMAFGIGLIYALGASMAVVIAFDVVLNGMAMFNHGDIRMAPAVERWLRSLLVTPDMHRIHNSADRAEHDANYGLNPSIWDQLLGTYVPEPAEGQEAMNIGLTPYQHENPTRLGWSLALPFFRR